MMTGYIDRHSLVTFYRFEEKQSRRLLAKLLRLMAFLLVLIVMSKAFLAVTHSLKICYQVKTSPVVITAGDSLWSIANRYRGEYPGTANGFIAEICRINQIENADFIGAGDVLQIPIYDYRFD